MEQYITNLIQIYIYIYTCPRTRKKSYICI